MTGLEPYGLDAAWRAAYAQSGIALAQAARVVGEQRGEYSVVTAGGVHRATAAGKLRHLAARPAVGDWVGLAAQGEPRIVAVLPRRTSIVRKQAGRAHSQQMLASNVDTALIVCAVGEANARKIERFASLVSQGGVRPVVVLNKMDLAADPGAVVAALQAALPGLTLCCMTAQASHGLAALAPYVQPGQTLVLVGSSGVGKTTLVNRLLGHEAYATGNIMDDGKRGKHTTTSRALALLPAGGIIMDTPGLREVGLVDADDGVGETFADIAALAQQCRFANCSHAGEPDCAVAQALQSAHLAPERYAAWQHLQQESQHRRFRQRSKQVPSKKET